MAQDATQALGIATPIIQDATVAAEIAVPLLRKAYESVKYFFAKYAEAQIKEIRDIRLAYKSICFSLEKSHSLNTLDLEGPHKKKDEKDTTDYPIYLRTRNNDEIPELYYRQFCPVSDSEDWRRMLVKNSPLNQYIEQAISTICNYQTKRDKRIIGSGYNYDPTNMFFEELKMWMVKLSSHKHMDQEILEITRGRYKYLGEIYAKGVFKPEDNEGSAMRVIQRLRNLFAKVIIPTIELYISRESARDHFDTLKGLIETRISLSIKFLFYIFRDNADTPINFDLEELRSPSDPYWQKIVNGTISGRLLQYLLNTNVMLHIFKSHTANKVVSLNAESFCQNDFIASDGSLMFPSSIEANLQEFNDGGRGGKNSTGVLSVFREELDVIIKFFRLHGLIQRLCVFYVLCEKLYELSGDGGNILVYGFARRSVQSILEEYQILNKEMFSIINFLYEKADAYKGILLEKGNYTGNVLAWDNLFYRAHKTHEELEAGERKSAELIHRIENKIIEVNSKQYEDEMKRSLESFFSLVNYFSGQPEEKPSNIVFVKEGGEVSFSMGDRRRTKEEMRQNVEKMEKEIEELKQKQQQKTVGTFVCKK